MSRANEILKDLGEAVTFPDPEDYKKDHKGWLKAIEEVGVKAITKGINSGELSHDAWFPSGYKYAFGGKEYPAILAKALVQSKAAESMTDLANTFYRGDKVSKAAMQIFAKDLVARPKALAELLQFGMVNTTKMIKKGAYVAEIKKALMKLSEPELRDIASAIVEYDGEEGLTLFNKSVGVSLQPHPSDA